MSFEAEGASNKPLERTAARIRSLAAAHWRRSTHHDGDGRWRYDYLRPMRHVGVQGVLDGFGLLGTTVISPGRERPRVVFDVLWGGDLALRI